MSTLRLEPQARPDAALPSSRITPADDATQKSRRVLIAGAGGVIGSAIAPYLAQQGHTVVRLVRRVHNGGNVQTN